MQGSSQLIRAKSFMILSSIGFNNCVCVKQLWLLISHSGFQSHWKAGLLVYRAERLLLMAEWQSWRGGAVQFQHRDLGPHTRFCRDPDFRRLSPSGMVQFWAVFLTMELEEEGVYLFPQLQAKGQKLTLCWVLFPTSPGTSVIYLLVEMDVSVCLIVPSWVLQHKFMIFVTSKMKGAVSSLLCILYF